MQRLINKQIILGVTGGIAAYKSADLARRLREAGAFVRVVMTAKAKEFITPLTLQAVSGNPVHDDLFDLKAEAAMGHIELARWADLILVAPATADFMARVVSGEANDLLTTVCLAAKAPVVLAPAMNQMMWKNTLTQQNAQALRERKVYILGPGEGSQACGDVGPGRMLEPLEIVDLVCDLFVTGSLAGQHVLITAGPTREAIDPVRFITNASSGKMGYALAASCVEAGAKVTLISGPVNLPVPPRVSFVSVQSAREMFAAVMQVVAQCDIFLAVAAVTDFRSREIAAQKIAKQDVDLMLALELNPDIVAEVANLSKRPFIVGFAAETHALLEQAKAKLKNKNLDMIIANEISQPGIGMGSDENSVTVLWKDQHQDFPRMSKQKLARELVALVATHKVLINNQDELCNQKQF
jgi:phosphopantothenoylcysteine decarboxylase/phosphopantothenate--cysteine ligase